MSKVIDVISEKYITSLFVVSSSSLFEKAYLLPLSVKISFSYTLIVVCELSAAHSQSLRDSSKHRISRSCLELS